jgi:hypothetical protein
VDGVEVLREGDPGVVVPALVEHLPLEGEEVPLAGPDQQPHQLVIDTVVDLGQCNKVSWERNLALRSRSQRCKEWLAPVMRSCIILMRLRLRIRWYHHVIIFFS